MTEFGVWTVDSDMDFYVIEPGPLAFTMSDSVSGASTTRWFQVTPVEE